MKSKGKSLKSRLVVALAILIVVPLAYFLFVRLEGQGPEVVLHPEFTSISESKPLSLLVTDKQSGLRYVEVSLFKDGKTYSLFEKRFPLTGLLSGGRTPQISQELTLAPKSLGISDGPALFKVLAADFSWRGWFHGNRTTIEKEVLIDTKAPVVEVLSRAHNVNPGGSGLVIYKVSEPCPISGVRVGDHLFPGYPGYFEDKNICLAFFALGYDEGSETPIHLEAVDAAGNSSRAGIPHHIRRKRFRKDVISVSDNFINTKLVEFDDDLGKGAPSAGVEKFLAVNSQLRAANFEHIVALCKNSEAKMMWQGVFERLPNSAPMAGFADHREYRYQGRTVDHQVHLGVDLASVAHSPVPAANSGKVVFTGDLGIYGQTVIIDHGFGLFSMYSHLSGFDIQQGQMVKKGDIIARTGSTGLAGGDHLHFAILIHDTFVNPVEWWDPAWIENNVTAKLDAVR